ncbi:peptide/nickel transport system ATP-binding protein [Ferrithrix thermotolerans DSM 19514]|uniref:Peptide/nickel transport system ATP-binding protein n=1 Tax=Ferrithrix thermotolerans DSM 19514 TaxID=1121881 RepID=A0A1M4XIC9_9ACTN|nr:ABC transporter ATP-binding protein [Ferrithrix thermotolerans]SHE93151.1 peptide/nickel transport system ATP-binding protein [Ferrithrix thermotolerans DSM 19514]
MSLLEIKDLKTDIKLRTSVVHAVDGVSMTIDAGESVGLVGESGCGKTMTGMSIMQLLPPGGFIASGSISLEGRDLTKISEKEMRSIRGNDIGMIFQDPMTSLNPCMTIGNQIAETVRLHRGASKKEALDRAAEVLALVGMPNPRERLSYYPHQLSGGLRQRVMIAMALSCEPKLLVADEPTTALDVTIQAQILSLLDDLREKLGMAMLLITHDMGVIAGRADRVVVMYAGKIVEEAETEELFQNTHHPYAEALLSSIPPLDRDVEGRLYSIPGLPPDLTNPPVGCRFAPRCRYAHHDCFDKEPSLIHPAEYDHAFACFSPVGAKKGEDNVTRIEITTDGPGYRRVYADHPETLMVLDKVSKEFPVTKGAVLQRKVGTLQAVTNVSLTIFKGETLGIVGESGCGKTTTGSMMVGLEEPTSGSIYFNGEDLTRVKKSELRAKRKDLQLMFQDPYASLDPRMRVEQIIREPLDVNKIGTKEERRKRVVQLLGEVGLSAKALERYPHEFSGGQRQRIGLARALALNPKLIVADEPVSALDVSIRSQVLNLMKDLQGTHDLTYVVISHDLSVVRYLADRIAVMYLGKVVEIGSGADIYERAAHPYTSALLTAVPIANPTLERKKDRSIVKGELPSAMNPPSGCRFRTRCVFAQDICAKEEPVMRSFGGVHEAACHFPLQSPVEDIAAVTTI